jgi:hypothetical protein
MSICCECCMLSGRGLCDGLITRPEEPYRLWCVVVCDLETSWMRRPWPTWGCRAKIKHINAWNMEHNKLISHMYSRINKPRRGSSYGSSSASQSGGLEFKSMSMQTEVHRATSEYLLGDTSIVLKTAPSVSTPCSMSHESVARLANIKLKYMINICKHNFLWHTTVH